MVFHREINQIKNHPHAFPPCAQFACGQANKYDAIKNVWCITNNMLLYNCIKEVEKIKSEKVKK